jgi:hypothetical protein
MSGMFFTLQTGGCHIMRLNEFVLLKSIFNENLHHAVLAKDAEKINEIVNENYQYELNNGFVEQEQLNTELLYTDHTEQLKGNFNWAL